MSGKLAASQKLRTGEVSAGGNRLGAVCRNPAQNLPGEHWALSEST